MGFSAFPIPKRSKIKGVSKKVNLMKISRLVNLRQQENAHDNNKFDVRLACIKHPKVGLHTNQGVNI